MAFQIAFYDLPTDKFENTHQTSMFTRIRYENIGYIDDIEVIGNTVRRIIEENQLLPENTVVLSQARDILRDIEHHYHQWSGLHTISTFVSYEQYYGLLQKNGLSSQLDSTANYKFESDEKSIENNKKLHFTTATDYLKMATIHSFKGWESANVIFILEPEVSAGFHKYCIRDNMNTPELIYTAITRAKENLFIINLGNDKYHDFFNSNI